MKPSAWLALTLLLAPCLAKAQGTAPADAPDKQSDYNKIVDHFFDMVQAGKFTDAAHVLVDTNPQDEFNVEKHESLAMPLQKISDTFGAFKTFKPIVSKTLGDGIGYVYGLAIYDRSPIRFEFMFYKDESSWRMIHVDFNLNYVPEIRDLAGVHVQPVFTTAPQPAPAPQAPGSEPKSPDNPEPPATPATPNGAPTLSAPPATPPASSSTNALPTSKPPQTPAPDSPTQKNP